MGVRRRFSLRNVWQRRGFRRFVYVSGGSVVLLVAMAIVLWFAFPFPIDKLAQWPQSPMVTGAAGEVLLERLAPDEQWRFPVPLDEMSVGLVQGTLAVEDARFYQHRGVDGWSVVRAVIQNLSSGEIISGASTLTMQVCRMTEPRPRSYPAKAIEAFRALQLERLRSKQQILETYLNMAPYGGNLRGVEAAARYYFGKSCDDLSLAESTLLAGIPQSPNRLRPDRHLNKALKRRDKVLQRMVETGVLEEQDRQRILQEPLALVARSPRSTIVGESANESAELQGEAVVTPWGGFARPLAAIGSAPVTWGVGANSHSTRSAWHVAWRALSKRPAGGTTSIDSTLQRRCEALLLEHMAGFPRGTEGAIVMLEVASGKVLAWVGSPDPRETLEGEVDGVLAWRSPGSTLKPFLFGVAFQQRRLDPRGIVFDIPIERGGWQPRNFDGMFHGAMTVERALRESRNVPVLLVVEALGVGLCRGTLESLGLHFLDETRVTGLTLATGGVEVRLIDLTNLYATLARGGVARNVRLFEDDPVWERNVFDRDVCVLLSDILSSQHRVPYGWEQRRAQEIPNFSWKTGTSSGRRDAWAIGHNGRIAIGVWVGDFSGRGHPSYVGREGAEPLLAQLFDDPWVRALGSEPLPNPLPKRPVQRPLPPPRERQPTLRIVTPEAGALYRLTTEKKLRLRPRTNGGSALTWFVDGEWVDHGARPTIWLEAGRHELRVVDADGDAASVEFFVRGA